MGAQLILACGESKLQRSHPVRNKRLEQPSAAAGGPFCSKGTEAFVALIMVSAHSQPLYADVSKHEGSDVTPE